MADDANKLEAESGTPTMVGRVELPLTLTPFLKPKPKPKPNPNQVGSVEELKRSASLKRLAVSVARLEPIKGQSGFVNWDARELPEAALRCAALVSSTAP